MARALAGVVRPDRLTVIVNVGDDETVYGVHVSPDLDTVVSTLAGVEGPHGWGRRDDTWTVVEALADLGVDTTFRLGDRDLATCLFRTAALADGVPLSEITARVARRLGVDCRVLPATDDPLRTEVRTDAGWRSFQEYFVIHRHAERVREVRFRGADTARAAPGAVAAVAEADVVIVAPSNPVLSVWPVLAVADLAAAVAAHERVVAVSPLFAGRALKGPAARVLADLGFPAGNAGVLAAYHGAITDLVVDAGDAGDLPLLEGRGVRIHALPTRFTDPAAAGEAAARILEVAK